MMEEKDLVAVEEAVVVVPKAPEKKYSFEQWASRAGIKETHKGGLKAFIKNIERPRTLAEWDDAVKNY